MTDNYFRRIAICFACGMLAALLLLGGEAWAKKAKFGVRQMTLELRGRCKACAKTAAHRQPS